MILHPALRALREDDRPQRVAQAALLDAMQAWRAGADATAVLAGVEAFAQGGELDRQPALAALFHGACGEARRFALDFAAQAIAALRGAPLGHVPLRHFTDGTTSPLLLARTGGTALALIALDGSGLAGRPAARTADFAPTDTWEQVLAGEGEAERIVCARTGENEARLERHPVALGPGSISIRDGTREALQVRSVRGCLVTLRLQRRRSDAGPTREYDLASGRLVHQAAGSPRDSRIELAMALLGRMGRIDAAPLLARIACSPGSAALRWQALRECLALDTLAGFRALSALAQDEGDALSAAAGTLRAQLVKAHPQLEALSPCPA